MNRFVQVIAKDDRAVKEKIKWNFFFPFWSDVRDVVDGQVLANLFLPL